MERTEIFSKVKEILVDILYADGGDAVQESARLKDDLGADSLDALEIDIELNKRFNITTDQEDLDDINNATVGDIVDMVERKLSSKNSKKL